ncbi:MAG: YdcF family protein [Patescibacteria group bacterium]|nr:YdcF family protein [Patescibacteria group bacterium]
MSTNCVTTIQAISDFLFLPANLEKAELIFVFGHSYLSTMDEVKKLYDKKYSNRILITGHSKGRLKDIEADRFFKRGGELGIPEKIFLLERKATNTKENILFSKPIIEKEIGFKNIKTILFVCKTFHTRRVLMTARKFFPANIKFCFYPVIDERNIQKNNWWKDDIARNRVLEEIKRIGEYALRGDLSIES